MIPVVLSVEHLVNDNPVSKDLVPPDKQLSNNLAQLVSGAAIKMKSFNSTMKSLGQITQIQ